MSDKYDDAIEWLVEHADENIGVDYTGVLERAWDDDDDKCHCLFQFATRGGGFEPRSDGKYCGCLTQIRSAPGKRVATTDELTTEILADTRIPLYIKDIDHLRGEELRAALQVFAFWQRRLDREIRTESP